MTDPTDPFGNLSGIFDSPDMRRERLFDTLGGIGSAMVQASMPRVGPPADPLQILAYGLAGGAQAGSNSEDRYLKRAMVGSQVAKAQQEMKSDQAWADLFKTPSATAAASPAPGSSAPTPTMTGPQTATAPNQQQFIDMMTPHVLSAAQQTGLDPRLIMAQSALETGYGRAAPGNNYFGIKGPGQTLNTTEAGPAGEIYPTTASFRSYADPGASAKDYVDFMKGNGGRYAPVLQAQGLDAQIEALGKSGYASDPQYAAKVRQIAQSLPALGPSPGGAAPAVPPTMVAQAGGTPVIPQGDQPPAPGAAPPQVAFRPQTMQDVIQSMPPGVRQMVGAMGRKEGMAQVLKYADPGSEAVFDSQTQQVVFIPKTMVGRDPRFTPVEGEKLNLERQRLTNEQRRTDNTIANSKVIPGNDGRPQQNLPLIEAEKAISAAQGSAAVEPHALKTQIDSTNKANTELQATALHARTGLAQINRLGSLLDQVSTGKLTSTTQDIKQLAKGIGLNLEAWGIKDDTAPAQAADALSKQLALSLRDPSQGGGMPGALSNSDREYLARMVPTLMNTPEGRKLMIEYARKMYQRSIDVAKIANDYARSKEYRTDPLGMHAKIQEYADANPLFADEQKKATDDYLSRTPAPPPGYSVPGQPQPGARPAPPAGFRIVQ